MQWLVGRWRSQCHSKCNTDSFCFRCIQTLTITKERTPSSSKSGAAIGMSGYCGRRFPFLEDFLLDLELLILLMPFPLLLPLEEPMGSVGSPSRFRPSIVLSIAAISGTSASSGTSVVVKPLRIPALVVETAQKRLSKNTMVDCLVIEIILRCCCCVYSLSTRMPRSFRCVLDRLCLYRQGGAFFWAVERDQAPAENAGRMADAQQYEKV